MAIPAGAGSRGKSLSSRASGPGAELGGAPGGAGIKASRLGGGLLAFLTAMLLVNVLTFAPLMGKIRAGYSDFAIFYTAGQIVRRGLGNRLYDAGLQWAIQQEFASTVSIRHSALPFNHAPFEALVFVPFAHFSYFTAFLLWNAMNLAILLALPLLLRSHLPELRGFSPALPFLACLSFFPVAVALVQGQDSILLLLFYTLALLALKQNREFAAGCGLGLGLFKFQLVLPFLLVFLLRRRFKVLAGTLAVAAALFLISLGAIGRETVTSYPRYVFQVNQTLASGAIIPRDMPNLRGFLDLLLGGRIPGTLLSGLVAALSLLIILLAALKWNPVYRLSPPAFDLGFSFNLLAAFLVSYHAYAHDMSLLLLPILLVADKLFTAKPSAASVHLTAVSTFLMFFSPLYMLLQYRWDQFAWLFLALLLFGGAILTELSRGGNPPLPGVLESARGPARRDGE